MKRLNSSQQTKQVAEWEKTPALEQGVIDITPTGSKREIPKPPPTLSSLLPKLVLGVFLGTGAIASGIYAYRWWHYTQQYAQKYQTTNNAYVSADIQPVTSSISGIVTNVAVNENQVVFPQDVLVKLDSRNSVVSLTQAKASLELAKQQAVLAQKKLGSLAMNAPEPEPVLVNNTQAKQAANKNRMLQAQAINQQSDITQQQYRVALAAIAQKQADVKKAELLLSYTNITALVAGKVGSKNVQIGQLVQPGQTLLTIVQPHPWIIANFRETQLEKIHSGQKVDIEIAAFPSRHFQGKIESLSPTSVSIALRPQDRATGNSTNSNNVQQIPVKIVLDPQSIRGYESRITPGMSAVAVVETK